MRTLHLLSIAAVSLASAAPALAQDGMAMSSAPVSDAAPFSGLYFGGSVGYDLQPNDGRSTIRFDRGRNGSFGEAVTTATGADAFSPGFCGGSALGNSAAGGCRRDKDDISYSGRVGFDANFQPFVVGLVGEFGTTDIKDSVTAFSTTPAAYTMERSVKWEAALRARAGFVAGNSTLIYGTAGPSYAKIRNRFFTTNTANAFSATGNDKVYGFNAGAGIEQKIGSSLSVGVEYMFHRYKDNDARVSVTQGTSGATNPFVLANGVDFRRSDTRFEWNSLKATAAFRF